LEISPEKYLFFIDDFIPRTHFPKNSNRRKIF